VERTAEFQLLLQAQNHDHAHERIEEDFPAAVEDVAGDGVCNGRRAERIHEDQAHDQHGGPDVAGFRRLRLLEQQDDDARPGDGVDQIVIPGRIDKEVILHHVVVLVVVEEVGVAIQEIRMADLDQQRRSGAQDGQDHQEQRSGEADQESFRSCQKTLHGRSPEEQIIEHEEDAQKHAGG